MGAPHCGRSGIGRPSRSIVNRLTPLQLRTARTLFALPAAAGFALAGGSALVALGVVDRETHDLDAFVAARPGISPGDVRPLAAALIATLGAEGWVVEVVRDHDTFARLLATLNDQRLEVDLAVDSPPLFPLVSIDGIPTLAPEDLAARKVLATLDRAEGRDFTDLWELSRSLGRSDCIRWAGSLDRGVTVNEVADAFARLDRIADDELPCSSADRLVVRTWFAEWVSELRRT